MSLDLKSYRQSDLNNIGAVGFEAFSNYIYRLSGFKSLSTTLTSASSILLLGQLHKANKNQTYLKNLSPAIKQGFYI